MFHSHSQCLSLWKLNLSLKAKAEGHKCIHSEPWWCREGMVSIVQKWSFHVFRERLQGKYNTEKATVSPELQMYLWYTAHTHTQTTLPSRTLKNMSLHKICTNKNCRCRKCNWKKGQRHKLAAIITILAEKPVGTRLISQQTKSLLSLYLKQCLCPVL